LKAESGEWRVERGKLFVVYGLLFIVKSCPEVPLVINENRKLKSYWDWI